MDIEDIAATKMGQSKVRGVFLERISPTFSSCMVCLEKMHFPNKLANKHEHTVQRTVEKIVQQLLKTKVDIFFLNKFFYFTYSSGKRNVLLCDS